MLGLIKIAGLSAVLAAGLVTGYEVSAAPPAGQAKLYTDRIQAETVQPAAYAQVTSGAIASDALPSCRNETWPYVSEGCINAAGAPVRKVARTITIEQRDAPNTSTLVRLPAAGR